MAAHFVYSFACLFDHRGLGKTVQTIATIHTLLQQSKFGKGDVRKAVVVTPSSLVDVWACTHLLGGCYKYYDIASVF